MVIITATLPQIFKTPVIPDMFTFDAFFYDENIVSESSFREVLQSHNVSKEALIFDIYKTREVAISMKIVDELESNEPLIVPDTGSVESIKQKYKMTCLGGTFDHLHLGHKLLLTNALFYTGEVIIIGITSSKLLSKKK